VESSASSTLRAAALCKTLVVSSPYTLHNRTLLPLVVEVYTRTPILETPRAKDYDASASKPSAAAPQDEQVIEKVALRPGEQYHLPVLVTDPSRTYLRLRPLERAFQQRVWSWSEAGPSVALLDDEDYGGEYVRCREVGGDDATDGRGDAAVGTPSSSPRGARRASEAHAAAQLDALLAGKSSVLAPGASSSSSKAAATAGWPGSSRAAIRAASRTSSPWPSMPR
jgi:hypothetical protein